MTQETKPTHVEEKVTERKIELVGDDSSAGTQPPQEQQGEKVSDSDNKSDNSDSSEKTE